ncbi:MAG: hypothetical protein WBC21_01335 [Minisyncoccales bacterium]
MTITRNRKIVFEVTSVAAVATIVAAILLLLVFPSEISEVPPSEESVIIPIIDSPTPTPTAIPSPTPAVSPTPTLTLTPTPTPRRGGGGGYQRPQVQAPVQVPVEELTGLQICDVDGKNCKRENIDPLINVSNIKPGDEGIKSFQLKNDNNKGGSVYLQIINESTDLEMFKEYFYLEVVFNNGNETITGNLSELEEPVSIGEIQEKQSLPLEMKWYFSEDAGNELQGKKIKFKIFFGLAEEQ